MEKKREKKTAWQGCLLSDSDSEIHHKMLFFLVLPSETQKDSAKTLSIQILSLLI